MKRTKKIALIMLAVALMAVCFVFGASAERAIIDSGECGAEGDNVTWTLYDDGELVISGEGEMESYFEKSSPFKTMNIKSILFEKGVTNAGNNAFSGIELETLDLSDSIEVIENGAFTNCEKLTEIKNIDNLRIIENFAFMGCVSLKKLNLPETLETVGFEILYGTESLEELTIAENNPYLICENFTVYSKDKKTLYLCVDRDIQKYVSPDTLQTVMPYAFFYCLELKEVVFGESVNHIRYLALPRNDKVTIYNPDCKIEQDLFAETIYGYEKSTAKQYAQQNSINFVAIDCEHKYGFGEWTVTSSQSCLAEGEEKRICLTCNFEEKRKTEKLSHSFTVFMSDYNSTCISDGTKTAYCDYGCGTSSSVTDAGSLDPVKHSFSEWVKNDEGESRVCRTCGYTETNKLSFFEQIIQKIVDFFKRIFGII